MNNLSEDCLDFKAFCDFLQNASGITLTPGKSYLVSARIRNIMVEHQLQDLSALIKALKNDQRLHQEVVDAMTTNETFWFRDDYPFQYFTKTLLPIWTSLKNKESSIKIWSAACSSGQEPYSLAMLCEEYKATRSFNKRVEILATDLSNTILKKAKLGQFDKLSIVRGLSQQRLDKFFSPSHHHHWQVNNELKRYIQFRSLNLLEPYSGLGKFDIIFCRNVLIYFTRETKTDILKRMHSCLKPGGFLCLGSSESLAGSKDLFSMVHCKPGIVYQAK
ncbi:MAG: chemotaxis protein methyltransferase CheR [Candidatus Endobugula sp.]|jgi:chemotaxis protein methyltransferase CheR